MTSTWLQALLQREGLRLDAYVAVSKVRSGRRLQMTVAAMQMAKKNVWAHRS